MESTPTTNLYQKIILIALAAMAVIFGIWTAVNRAESGVEFREELLRVSTQGDATVYSGTLYDTPITITCREENGTKLVNFSADGAYYAECRVEYPEGTIKTEAGKNIPRLRILRNDEVLFSGGYDPKPEHPGYQYYDENGKLSLLHSFSVEDSTDPWYYFRFDAWDIMLFAKGPTVSRQGNWLIYIGALVLSLMTAALVYFREEVFYFTHFLLVKDPEPTDLYRFTHMVSSILVTGYIFYLYWKGVHTFLS